MTDKELIQALRGCSSRVWTTPNRAADRLEALIAENEHLREVTKMVPQWVSVKERLPALTVDDRYLIKHFGWSHAPEYIVKIADSERTRTLQFDGKEWFDVEGCTYTVTHWQPLPEPPSTEGSPTGQKE